jgi:hypothetical protein
LPRLPRREKQATNTANSERETLSMLIFHYHLFKNAGTSVDEMLKANFGDRWEQAEFASSGPGYANVDQVTAYLKARPQLRAFSSHTAFLPLPQLDRPIFPIFFIRHPIDRIKSAYTFESKQVADTHGAQLAKEHNFVGYVRQLLDTPGNRQARNFHTHRLAYNEPKANGTELERALRTLDALPFVGLVEEYEKSMLRLRQALADVLPDLKIVIVHANKTQEAPEPMEGKLKSIERALGEGLYAELMAANADDFALYKRVQALYAEVKPASAATP